MKSIKNYIWFIKESQSYMKGHNRIIIFFQSLYKGFGFVKLMKGSD